MTVFFCGTTPVVVSGVGSGGSSYPIECGFDADHFLTRIDYPDSTFEEYEYNDFKQITRHRDRKSNVQLWVYDSAGNLLEHKVGLKEVSGSDVQQAEYAVYEYEYYSTPAALKGNLKTAFSPLHTSETDLYRTDYEYLTNGQLESIIESADVASGTRPETTFTYNSLGQVATVTDPEAHTTTYTDDYLGRLRRITYHDSSSDYAHFGTAAAGLAGQVIWTKDRMDVVTSFTYDDLYRVTDTVVGSHTADSSNNLTAITDVTQQRSTSTAFIGTTRLPQTITTDGKYTLYDYDYRHRLIKTRRWPNATQVLQTRTVYDNYNRVFYTEDPYERREYMGYSATNEPSLIRRVQANHAGYTLANNAAVLAVTRSTSPNAAYAVVDAIKDASGNLEEVIDARGISTTYVYDSRDRETSHIAADGTSVAAQTDTIYNKASQVTEVRSPRYFDSGDAQDEYMRTLFTYTGRGLQKTQQVAPGASWFADATTSTTYTLDGKVATTTDALSNVWTTHHDNGCCGHFVGSEDPLGHGSMTYSDNMGRAYHGVSVSDYDTHSGSNPTDVKTLSEWTTRFDNLGRSVKRLKNSIRNTPAVIPATRPMARSSLPTIPPGALPAAMIKTAIP